MFSTSDPLSPHTTCLAHLQTTKNNAPDPLANATNAPQLKLDTSDSATVSAELLVPCLGLIVMLLSLLCNVTEWETCKAKAIVQATKAVAFQFHSGKASDKDVW